jgi:glutathione peroxidase
MKIILLLTMGSALAAYAGWSAQATRGQLGAVAPLRVGSSAQGQDRLSVAAPRRSSWRYGAKTILVLSLALCLAVAGMAGDLAGIALKDIDGKATSLKQYEGKALLVVNVASKCGLTPQYEGLERLYQKYQGQGLVVLGFPCNDFAGQEPGANEEIKKFCSTKYAVTFPLFDKLHVKGPEQHPLYAALTGKDAKFPGEIEWNFGKFLIARDGKVLQRFVPQVKPDDVELVAAIEAALKK